MVIMVMNDMKMCQLVCKVPLGHKEIRAIDGRHILKPVPCTCISGCRECVFAWLTSKIGSESRCAMTDGGPHP